MSVTIVIGKRHLLAGLSLLILIALLGVALIVPAVSEATTTYYTRSASCAGRGFYPDNTSEPYGTIGTARINGDTSGTAFYCAAALPSGAIVTKVQFTLYEGGSCYLTRSGSQSSAYMAGPLTNVAGEASHSTTAITHATIDNVNYSYLFECDLDPQGAVIGADVIYKVSAANA